jgi:hypothetical protein
MNRENETAARGATRRSVSACAARVFLQPPPEVRGRNLVRFAEFQARMTVARSGCLRLEIIVSQPALDGAMETEQCAIPVHNPPALDDPLLHCKIAVGSFLYQ